MMGRLIRSWALILAVMLWGITAAAMSVPLPAPVSAPVVRIRWSVGLADPDRIAVERQFGLVQGQFVAETVWSYALLDESDENAKALLRHPSAIDSDGFNRERLVLHPSLPRVPVPPELRMGWMRPFATYWRSIPMVSGLAAMALTAIALRRQTRWLLAYSAAIVLAASVLFWPIGSGESVTTLGAVLKEKLSGLEIRRPGWEREFPDETLFGWWFTLSGAPCKDGPGEFSMGIKADWTVQITSRAEGTRVYRIEELRRAAITPRAWERASVVLRASMPDGAGVRMLLRQTRANNMEPFRYELQAPEGDITILPDPPPLVNCGQRP